MQEIAPTVKPNVQVLRACGNVQRTISAGIRREGIRSTIEWFCNLGNDTRQAATARERFKPNAIHGVGNGDARQTATANEYIK